MAENKYKQSETKTRALVTDKTGQKSHRDRKNPRSADLWREAKHARNAERPFQFYNTETKTWSNR